MDIEERLEQAEKSETPSLVGSSIRSADDSSHKNYIHPEKYHSTKDKSKINNKLNHYSNLSNAITASLDDLINEGALLGSEADFDKFLEQDGSVKTDAIMDQDAINIDEEGSKKNVEENPIEDSPIEEKEKEVSDVSLGISTPPETATNSAPASSSGTTGSSSFYQQEDYSTPNLSEYQLEHDIKDQTTLLDHVQSYDLEKLPTSASASSSNSRFRKDQELPISQSQQTLLSPAQQQRLEDGGQIPFLHTERARSRSRSANPNTRIRDKSSSSSTTTPGHTANISKPHLARGDSYKSTHDEEPSKYELPGHLKVEVPAHPAPLDERRSRQSKPTMGESIAAAEANVEALSKSDNPAFQAEHPLPRDPSLLTGGDYTHFEVDAPKKEEEPLSNTYYTKRSESATNYLRSISRSRSRARNPVQDEKNDSNNDALQREGALISDDPYDTIDKLDSMMEEVLSLKDSSHLKKKKKNITHEELIEEDIERAKQQSNEKDDANTDVLVEEGALVNEDECTLIDKKDLEKEGISTEETKEKKSKTETETSTKDVLEEAEDKEVSEEADDKETKEVNDEPEADEDEEKLETKEIEEAPVSKVEDDSETKGVKEPETTEAEEDPKADVPPTATKDDDDLEDLDISPEEIRKHLESQPIYIFTSLAGGMQIMPRTNRLATILQANGIKFEYRDLGTDEEAKKIWKRQANGKALPGVVRGDDFIGNWHDIDEANEEYKLRELLYETL